MSDTSISLADIRFSALNTVNCVNPVRIEPANRAWWTAPKDWRDIWGSGQDIGAVREVTSVAERVDELAAQYAAAKCELAAKT